MAVAGLKDAGARRATLASDYVIGPSHAHDLDVAIGKVVPENARKASGDMAVQVAAGLVPMSVINVRPAENRESPQNA